MEKKEKKGNLPALIICIVLFIALVVVQRILTNGNVIKNETLDALKDGFNGIVNEFNIPAGRAQAVNGPIEGLEKAGSSSLNGIIGQFHVLISVVLVLTNRKRGYIAAIILNLLNSFLAFGAVFATKNMSAAPGGVVPLVSILISGLIYLFLSRNDKMHEELSASYQEAIEKNRVIQEKDDVLQYLAYYDRLTQMPNRQLFMENLEENIGSGDDCIVIYIDIDDFRRINDNFGHSTGDELLKEYSAQIEKLCGDDIFAARIGGDEFGLILPGNMSNDDVVEFSARISGVFARPVDVRGDSFSVNASYGVAAFPADARSAEDLFRCAETAMFTAKTGGKNQLCFYRRAQ
ncbi:MAG: diguanylate cyclase [Ruminococcus sp.]|nr:diguanylate cyclase [Ruminococcus sp.]